MSALAHTNLRLQAQVGKAPPAAWNTEHVGSHSWHSPLQQPCDSSMQVRTRTLISLPVCMLLVCPVQRWKLRPDHLDEFVELWAEYDDGSGTIDPKDLEAMLLRSVQADTAYSHVCADARLL
jgi:hypothetical protein